MDKILKKRKKHIFENIEICNIEDIDIAINILSNIKKELTNNNCKEIDFEFNTNCGPNELLIELEYTYKELETDEEYNKRIQKNQKRLESIKNKELKKLKELAKKYNVYIEE